MRLLRRCNLVFGIDQSSTLAVFANVKQSKMVVFAIFDSSPDSRLLRTVSTHEVVAIDTQTCRFRHQLMAPGAQSDVPAQTANASSLFASTGVRTLEHFPPLPAEGTSLFLYRTSCAETARNYLVGDLVGEGYLMGPISPRRSGRDESHPFLKRKVPEIIYMAWSSHSYLLIHELVMSATN